MGIEERDYYRHRPSASGSGKTKGSFFRRLNWKHVVFWFITLIVVVTFVSSLTGILK